MGKKLSELVAATVIAADDIFHLRTLAGIDKKIKLAISEWNAVTDFDETDIFHLRTDAGVDKKITGANLRHDLGMIAPFARKVNMGWLWCDGSTINKTTDPEYEALVDYLKAEAGADAAHPYYHADADKAILPDLRGAAVRGIDAAANRDKDGIRKSGDYQADQMENHTHTTNIGSHGHNFKMANRNGSGANYFYITTLDWYANSDITKTTMITSTNIGNKTSGNPSVGGGAAETIMKNIALYYLIRY